MNTQLLIKTFKEYFQKDDFDTFFAPGRINLIGEHTDYNGGHVFPCAITYGTYALASKRKDNKIRLFSMNFPEKGMKEFTLDNLNYTKDHDWANYPKGMIRYLIEAGFSVTTGMDVLYYGNIPNGAGLSSSASIELVTGVMLEKLYHLTIDRLTLVKTGKRVENEFIGVNTGIMDQFAIGMGKEGHGVLLDCQTLQFEYAPLDLTNHRIIIMNTNKRRELADSKYNERRNECEQALADIKQVVNIQSLGDLTEDMFEKYKDHIKNEVIQKRAKHAVYENRRTLNALEALKSGNLEQFGKLMNESHCSLRDDYEVTGQELDTLVASAWQQKGVIGARMTGAGFGGCALAIVKKDEIDHFQFEVGKTYREKIGYEATFLVATVGAGAREIEIGGNEK